MITTQQKIKGPDIAPRELHTEIAYLLIFPPVRRVSPLAFAD